MTTLIKEKFKFSSYMSEFRRDRVQSHIVQGASGIDARFVTQM
jgi:hypothetical protein